MSAIPNDPLPEISKALKESNESDISSVSSDDEVEEELNNNNAISALNSNSNVMINNISKRRETELLNTISGSLRKLKLFPIFGDQKLAQISVNYFLYLEFFHGIIRILSGVLLFTVLLEFLLWIIPKITSSESVKDILPYCYQIIMFFLFASLTRRERQRVLQEKVLYDFQWSEDAFSVFAEGLPADVTKEDITSYFQALLDAEGNIVDIIHVQDYRKYVPLNKELEKMNKKLKKANQKGAKQEVQEGLLKKIQIRQAEINQMNQEFSEMKHFGGKMIVIFDTVWAQNQIVKQFSYGYFKSLLISCFKSYFPQHYLGKHRITVKALPEPRDINYHNLYYSASAKRARLLFAWILSWFLMTYGLLALVRIQAVKIENVHHQLVSYLFSLGILLLTTVMEAVYKYIQKLYINPSALEDKLGALEYYFAISAYAYNLSQVLPIILYRRLRENFVSNLLSLVLLFCAKSIIVQSFQIYFTTKSLTKSSDSLVQGLLHKARAKYIEFDFIKGLSRALPPIAIGSFLAANNPFIILPILIAILYITAILDKYRIIKTCNLFSAKSAYFMLKPFWIYNWITLLAFISTLFRVYLTKPYSDMTTGYYVLGLSGLGVLFTCYCQTPMDEKVRGKFIEMNANVRYESVCAEFSSSFRKTDPYYKNKISNSNKELYNNIL